MSWSAYLTDDRGHTEGDWNYTHNCNGMANLVMSELYPAEEIDTWWKKLDGMEGPEGAKLLDGIIKGLEADPEKFRAMNPPNGWGDYDSFLRVLTEMRNRVPEWPAVWSTNG